jgi:hypothetical protein
LIGAGIMVTDAGPTVVVNSSARRRPQASSASPRSTIAASDDRRRASIRTKALPGVAPEPTIYQWAGEQAAFEGWLNTFYDLVEQDELIALLFGGTVSEEHRRRAAVVECMGGTTLTEGHA